MRLPRGVLALPVVLISLTATAQNAEPQTVPASQLQGDWQGSAMLGSDVVSRNGDDVGEVDDVMVGKNGQLDSIVVQTSALVGIDAIYFSVPWNKLAYRPGQEGFRLQMTEQQVDSEPKSQSSDFKENKAMSTAVALHAAIMLPDNPDFGSVRDILFNPRTHQLDAVLVEANDGGQVYALKLTADEVGKRKDGLTLPWTSAQLHPLPAYQTND